MPYGKVTNGIVVDTIVLSPPEDDVAKNLHVHHFYRGE
jgi:hypothetical protein